MKPRPEGPQGSLYIPKPHLVEDRRFLHDFMDEFPFADLVTAGPSIRITHIPVLLDRAAGKYGTLLGHMARHNEQAGAFDGSQPAVVVFRGPHSYISPTWYTKPEAVPTWNFAVVHATGRLKAVEDRAVLQGLVTKLVHRFEGTGGNAYDVAKLQDAYLAGMIAGIIGFEMEIELLEGKFKLGQERCEGDRRGILQGLASARPERNIYELTEAFYRRND